MSSKYFEAAMFKWIIVANEHYGELRKQANFGGYQDIEEVQADKENIRNGLIALGARETDIITLTDAPFKQLSNVMKELVADCNRFNSLGIKTLIFFYYAGHGAMQSGQSVCVLNETRKFFPIEKQLRAIANLENSYVIALLDCCRETIREQTRGGQDDAGAP